MVSKSSNNTAKKMSSRSIKSGKLIYVNKGGQNMMNEESKGCDAA